MPANWEQRKVAHELFSMRKLITRFAANEDSASFPRIGGDLWAVWKAFYDFAYQRDVGQINYALINVMRPSLERGR